ncbi:MAG: hypothetical protein WBC91_26180 [Phototrophicaceae bacterium]
MNKPDPVQHMMLWGAVSSSIILAVYFLLVGSLSLPDVDPVVLGLLVAGIFGGFTLGGMSGVIIGAVFQHNQDGINHQKLHNRRYAVWIAVFMMVLLISRILLVLAFGLVAHPLILSLLGAGVAALASQHYLHRMEDYLKQEKPKRKNDSLPSRLLDDVDDSHDALSDNTPYEQASTRKNR